MREIFLLLIASVMIMLAGCTNMAPEVDEEDPGTGDCTPLFPEMDVTYTNYVKGVVDKYCIQCHRGGNSPAPGNFTNYAGVKAYANDVFYVRVIQDNADMPRGMAPLPKATRDSLNVWIRNCAPEN